MANFERVEKQLTDYIRNPTEAPPLDDVELRRLNIYRDLFYNNIEGFVSSAFPILRSITCDDAWHEMVRDFMICYHCKTPYFLEICQEFLAYLPQRAASQNDPPFMLELAHYEWLELALDVDEQDLEKVSVDINGDMLGALPVVSPLARSLAYQFPVHRIGPGNLPDKPSDIPHYLVVYRNRDDSVEFMEANAVTARLLALLQEGVVQSGEEALERLAQEMHHPNPSQVIKSGGELLQQLHEQDIILGTQPLL